MLIAVTSASAQHERNALEPWVPHGSQECFLPQSDPPMVITHQHVVIFSRYRGNHDRWIKSGDANSISEEEWDLMDELMAIKMKERGLDVPANRIQRFKEVLLSYCDTPETAQELLSATRRYSDPRNWGFWSRLAHLGRMSPRSIKR